MFPLIFDILPDNGDRRSAAACSKITWRPEHTFPVTGFQLRVYSTKASGGCAFKTVHQLRDRHFRRIVNKQMNVISFTVTLDKHSLEILTYF